MSTRIRRARRRAPILFVAVVALLAVAQAASAHVTVASPDGSPGGFGTLVFRVPSESATASTVKLTVALPAATPFANLSAKELPGWSVTTTERKLAKPITDDDGFNLTKAVSTVTWTAAKGAGVPPGEFQEFVLSVGPFPKGNAAITLPTVQTYSDGKVVRWAELTPASGKEPENPVPTLRLVSSSPRPGAGQTSATSTTSAPRGDNADGLARWLGGAGLALGVAALLIAIWSTRRRKA
jgi:periplasmic copper chaperone A